MFPLTNHVIVGRLEYAGAVNTNVPPVETRRRWNRLGRNFFPGSKRFGARKRQGARRECYPKGQGNLLHSSWPRNRFCRGRSTRKRNPLLRANHCSHGALASSASRQEQSDCRFKIQNAPSLKWRLPLSALAYSSLLRMFSSSCMSVRQRFWNQVSMRCRSLRTSSEM